MKTYKIGEGLSLALFLVFLFASCQKSDELNQMQEAPYFKYERYASGSYNMWYDTQQKSLGEEAFLTDFERRLRDLNAQKSDGKVALNEAVYSLEGLVNMLKADARPTKVLKEDRYDLIIPIAQIDEDGEIWLNESDLPEIYAQIDALTEVFEGEKLSMADIDVIDITASSVGIKLFTVVSESWPGSLSFSWFEEGDSYMAIGEQLINDPYELPFEPELEDPAHIGYAGEQPYPAWIHINDRLNLYYGVIEYQFQNGDWTMGLSEKTWFTNTFQTWEAGTSLDYLYIDSEIAFCSYGRMDYIYMAGSQWSPYLVSTGASCGCEDAPVEVFAAQVCGNYCQIGSDVADEVLSYDRMNRYMQSSMDYIDNKLATFANSGSSPNPGIANISYMGAVLPVNCIFSNESICHVRYHNLQFILGTQHFH